jgi:hypothetical protein
MMTRLVKAALILSFAVLLAATPASSGTIVIDEFPHGAVNGAGTDPGPGGLTNVVIYTLPFAGVAGDVILEGPVSDGESDVVRFNDDGTVIFYSDNNDGFDACADTLHAVSGYPNTVTVQEIGPEANNQVIYTPLPGQAWI